MRILNGESTVQSKVASRVIESVKLLRASRQEALRLCEMHSN